MLEYSMTSIPSKYKPFYWDVDIENLDTNKYKNFIIERALEKGRIDLLVWIFSVYTVSDVLHVLSDSKNISNATKLLWGKVLI